MSVKLLPRAVRLLAGREHSRKELAAKLSSHASAGEVEETLDKLETLGYLSDRRYAETFVQGRMARWGKDRLERELHQRGIDEELATVTLDKLLGQEDEADRALAVLLKKEPRPIGPRSKAEMRCRRFLATRGFGSDAIRLALAQHAQEHAVEEGDR